MAFHDIFKGFDKNPFIRLCLISSFIVILDQITKQIIKSSVQMYETIPVIGGFFNIVFVENPGGAFGLLSDQSIFVRKFVFLFLSSIIAVFVLWFYKKICKEYFILSCGIAMIFGGAVGNLIDRFRFEGKVVDFLDFYIKNYHWPAFNVADSAINIGMGILLYHILFNKISDF
ncbi:MAG: signal peptidase II [Desulfobacteraceae bacterium]|nr:signal peptidase II [Desulfobacteraceae bacterium]